MSNNPRIYLGVDNCFASKRFGKPEEWVKTIYDLGLYYVEASADNECDPLYMGTDYLKRWCADVDAACAKYGVRIANMYSGHGTYATLGLAHYDEEVRDRFLNSWLKPMSDVAVRLNAGMGFFCHAFDESVLQDYSQYDMFYTNLVKDLADLAVYANKNGCTPIGVEQMYSPHQVPWTVSGAEKMMREIYELSGKSPFYITIDTGHQTGQKRFVRPTREELEKAFDKKLEGDKLPKLWLGTQIAFDLFDNATKPSMELFDEIENEMDLHPYMFATMEDSDTYNWLSNLGCYSPIVHLQQTDGISSSHWPFTPDFNAKGVIEGKKVLESLYKSFERPDNDRMPPKVDNIYLTLEMFTGTADINRAALQRMRETVEYWRQYIPRDGMTLKEAVEKL